MTERKTLNRWHTKTLAQGTSKATLQSTILTDVNKGTCSRWTINLGLLQLVLITTLCCMYHNIRIDISAVCPQTHDKRTYQQNKDVPNLNVSYDAHRIHSLLFQSACSCCEDSRYSRSAVKR